MRGRFKAPQNHSTEFELDLAPLLAVMVKLVPVLLVSSGFVQLMNIETDLPQVVKETIQRQEQDPKLKKASVNLEVSLKDGFKITVEKDGQSKVQAIPLAAGGLDMDRLQTELVQVKAENPETFRIELSPDPSVSYKDLVRVMDEARRARDRSTRFVFMDPVKNAEVDTDFMFPDVVFTNMME